MTFSKRVSSWIWSKNRTFSYGRFSQKTYQKTSLLILWKEKNDCNRKKLKFSKGPKNGHFPMGLVHGYCPKIKISLIAFFHLNYVRKHRFFDIYEKKQSFLDQKIEF